MNGKYSSHAVSRGNSYLYLAKRGIEEFPSPGKTRPTSNLERENTCITPFLGISKSPSPSNAVFTGFAEAFFTCITFRRFARHSFMYGYRPKKVSGKSFRYFRSYSILSFLMQPGSLQQNCPPRRQKQSPRNFPHAAQRRFSPACDFFMPPFRRILALGAQKMRVDRFSRNLDK